MKVSLHESPARPTIHSKSLLKVHNARLFPRKEETWLGNSRFLALLSTGFEV